MGRFVRARSSAAFLRCTFSTGRLNCSNVIVSILCARSSLCRKLRRKWRKEPAARIGCGSVVVLAARDFAIAPLPAKMALGQSWAALPAIETRRDGAGEVSFFRLR